MPQEIELVHCEAPTYDALCTPKEKTFHTAPSLDLKLTREALPSLALSMVGLIFSGWFLDITQYWFVFKQHSELLIMVLVLLNLKGNLEMTLSSRLATAANNGTLGQHRGAMESLHRKSRLCATAVRCIWLDGRFRCLSSFSPLPARIRTLQVPSPGKYWHADCFICRIHRLCCCVPCRGSK